MSMPGDLGLAEFEFAHQQELNLETLGTKRGECAGGAAELADEHPWADFVETREMPLDRGEHRGGLETESYWNGVLQLGAPRHQGSAIALDVFGKRGREGFQIFLEQVERCANL